jgi:RNA polymerase-associated protein LEO1
MNVIKVSNVVGIDPKPFNPEIYVEEDTFITDKSEGKKRMHMNVVRCRMVKNADGTESVSPMLPCSSKRLF